MNYRISKKGISKMNKPEKVYLNNPNLLYALTQGVANASSIRETFFFNQLHTGRVVSNAPSGDFFIDNKYTIEVGGRNKRQKQIAEIRNAYNAADKLNTATRTGVRCGCLEDCIDYS